MISKFRENPAFYLGAVAGIIFGFMGGAVVGGLIVKDNYEEELLQAKDQIRITINEMNLKSIEIEELIDTLNRWQLEIDEIWIYYGAGRFKCRVMESARPSTTD